MTTPTHVGQMPDVVTTIDPIEKPAMRLAHLKETVEQALSKLELGARSYSRSSAYHDYVALAFHAAFFTQEDARQVQKLFRVLCDRHGWECLRVTLGRDPRMISVTMHKSPMISVGPAGDARMQP